MLSFIDIGAWKQTWRNSWTETMEGVGELIPDLLGALVLLFVGWLVSHLASLLVARACRRLGLDRVSERTRLTDGLVRAGVGKTPSALVGSGVFWILMLVFVLSAVETLGVRAVTTTIDQFVAYIPQIVATALIVVFGLLIGRLARTLISSGAAMANLPRSNQLGQLGQGVVVLVIGIVALEQLGIRTQILVNSITALLVVLGLTLGVTFALGSHRIVNHILAGQYLRKSLSVGSEVEVNGRKGIVEQVGAVDTHFRDEDQMWSVPNAVLLEQVIAR